MKINDNRLIAWIFALLSLSTSAYASYLTDDSSNALLSFNKFFESYNSYSQAIDFLFFSLLFISVYLIGVRYAFREVRKPEKTIAVLLGIMTAFSLVSAGFSITFLVPYVQWVFYFLLFFITWVLLKGVKSKFWRLVLALLITMFIIVLFYGYLNDFEIDFKGWI